MKGSFKEVIVNFRFVFRCNEDADKSHQQILWTMKIIQRSRWHPLNLATSKSHVHRSPSYYDFSKWPVSLSLSPIVNFLCYLLGGQVTFSPTTWTFGSVWADTNESRRSIDKQRPCLLSGRIRVRTECPPSLQKAFRLTLKLSLCFFDIQKNSINSYTVKPRQFWKKKIWKQLVIDGRRSIPESLRTPM